MSIIDDTKSKMKHAVEHLQSEYKSLRTNRVNPHMLDDIKVSAYGTEMQLKALANTAERYWGLSVWI